VTISAPLGFTSYSWSNGSSGQSIVVSPNSTQTYSVSVSSGSGCQGVDDVIINVNPLPLAYAGENVTVCNHNPVFLQAEGGDTYAWSNGAMGDVIQVNPTSNQTFTVTVTNVFGCTSSDNVSVFVFPALNFILTLSEDTVCPGSPIVINAEIYGGMGAPYIVFDDAHQVITFPWIYTPVENTSLTFTLIDQCNMPLEQTVQIITYPLPPVDFYPDINSGCTPLTVQFNEQNPDVPGQQYLWDFHDSGYLSYQKNPEHTYRSPGLYDISLTVTSVNLCKNTVTLNNLITVYPVPESRYEADPIMASIIKPIISFNNLSQGATDYIWHFGDGDSSSHINSWHQYQSIGEYTTSLIAINQYDCRDTSILDVKIIDEQSFYAPTAFSPNSDNINDYFFVTGNALLQEGFKLCIYDRWGQIIWETSSFDTGSQTSATWDGTSNGKKLEPATYVWYVQYKDFTNTSHYKAGHVTLIW
jgi:gliding motility-associated-like protein